MQHSPLSLPVERLAGVRNQIDQDLFQLLRVAFDGGEVGSIFNLKSIGRLLDQIVGNGDCQACYFVDVDPLGECPAVVSGIVSENTSDILYTLSDPLRIESSDWANLSFEAA
jgi:hypothetical protein